MSRPINSRAGWLQGVSWVKQDGRSSPVCLSAAGRDRLNWRASTNASPVDSHWLTAWSIRRQEDNFITPCCRVDAVPTSEPVVSECVRCCGTNSLHWSRTSRSSANRWNCVGIFDLWSDRISCVCFEVAAIWRRCSLCYWWTVWSMHCIGDDLGFVTGGTAGGYVVVGRGVPIWRCLDGLCLPLQI